MKRRCQRVQGRLPLSVRDELPRWRQRLVDRHLRRCDDCAAEDARQRRVLAGLADLGRAVDDELEGVAPPADLLPSLLEQAADPGLRGRVASPARGAVSGARPGLSLALALVVLGLALLTGWAGWRLGRAARRRREG